MNEETYSEKGEKPGEKDEKCSESLTILKAQNLVTEFNKAISDSGWLVSAENSWKRYRQQDPTVGRNAKKKRFPLWYTTGKIRQPLVFSKVPKIVVQPIVPDKQGFVTEVAGVCEKLGRVLLEQFPFFSVARSSSDDNLLTSLGVARVMVDAEFVTEPARQELTLTLREVMGPQGQPVPQEVVIDSDGNPVDPALVKFTYDGQPYLELEETVERVEKETAFLKSVCYRDFIWDWEARDFAEWDYCAFRSRLTKRQVVKRFGPEALEKLPKEDTQAGRGDDQSRNRRRKFDIVELWWKPSKKRYIFAMGGEEFIKESPDPLKLQGFFPIAYPLFTNLGTEDSIPFCEYEAVKGILDHIDDIYDRKAQALRVSRPRGLYDSSVQELKVLASNTTTTSKDWIGVPNLATKAQQGSTFTQYFDTGPVVAALQEYRTEFAEQLQAYDQITRLSDAVRGVTNPYESATATERKQQAVNHGIIDQQQDMQRWCRDSIVLLVDAALAHFSDERLFELLEPSLTDNQRQQFDKIIAKLKTDSWRVVSLDIETDSTILIDEDVDKQQANELAETIGALLDRAAAAVQQAPESVPLIADLIEFVVSKHRSGKEFQDKIAKQIEAMAAAAAKRQAQASEPPQPTPYEQFQMQLAQNDQHVKAMQAQVQAQKAQADFQIKNRELDRKDFEAQLQASMKAQEAMLEQQRFQLEQVMARFEMQMEQAAITIEDFKARAQAAESMAEEIRLAKDTENNQIRTMIEAQRPEMPQNAQTPMIISVPQVPETSGPRTVLRTKQDSLGNTTQEIEEETEL